jgi:hypothetical protein
LVSDRMRYCVLVSDLMRYCVLVSDRRRYCVLLSDQGLVICVRSPVETLGSNPPGIMDVCRQVEV